MFTLYLFCAFSNSLLTCAEKISEVTKKDHFLLEDIKEKKFKAIKFEGDSQKLDKLFSLILNRHGFTRIPVEDSFIIINTRDVRYEPTELLSVENFKKISKTYDYKMVNYRLKNKLIGKNITRSLRPFMSRYGRVINNVHSGIITIQDTAVNIERILELIDLYDVPFSDEEQKEYEKEIKHQRKIELISAKNPSALKHN